MSEDVREAFEAQHKKIWPFLKFTKHHGDETEYASGTVQNHFQFYQAATASTEAKWRGLVEKLVEALASVKCDMYDSLPLCSNICEEVEEALTHAAELLGRK